ncbi:CAP domain-containing protein, partial [Trichophaea hybrida]
LTWNPYLASRAQDWADRCDKVHSGAPVGENLGANYRDVGHVCHAWGRNERPLYDYAAGVMTPKNGHFTQMVWKGTREVGCGVTECFPEIYHHAVYPYAPQKMYVCQYWPPGNVIGRYQENVFPP